MIRRKLCNAKIGYHSAMKFPLRNVFLKLFAGACLIAASHAFAIESALALSDVYAQKVDRRLSLPEQEQRFYAEQLMRELQKAAADTTSPQYALLVDRSPQVQAILLFWISDAGTPEFIGASPVSTGRKGGFMYYQTPLGVFDHTIANLDFRAEGTENALGILGYGVKGMRVYDFGWAPAQRMWKPGTGKMRLQMHATDPRYLEPRLGTVQSMGCIRIPATLNILIDHYGLLDADYEKAIARGRRFWALRPDREPTPWSGRYLVVIDSERATRPDWSPRPTGMRNIPKKKPAAASPQPAQP